MKYFIIKLICVLNCCFFCGTNLYSQIDIAVRNINRGIELGNEGKYELALFYLSIGLKNVELSDSIRNIGELYRQCSYCLILI